MDISELFFMYSFIDYEAQVSNFLKRQKDKKNKDGKSKDGKSKDYLYY